MSEFQRASSQAIAAGLAGLGLGGPVGAMVGVATSLIPELVRSLAGEKAGDTAKDIATVVQTVAGTTDPVEALQTLQSDSTKLIELKMKLLTIQVRAEEERRQAELAALQLAVTNTTNAREVGNNSPILQRAQINIGYAVLVLFASLTVMVMLVGVSQGVETILNVLLGILSGSVMAVVNFFFGGSFGSQDKTGVMSRIASAVVGAPPPTDHPARAPKKSIFS